MPKPKLMKVLPSSRAIRMEKRLRDLAAQLRATPTYVTSCEYHALQHVANRIESIAATPELEIPQ